MICSACQQKNEPAYQVCSRCGVRANRDVPPSLILGSLLTRDIIWGINLAGLAIPLALLAGGVWAAVFVWDRVGFSSYWTVAGFALLVPGIVFALSLLPAFRRVQSMLFGLGVFVMFGLLAGGAGGLFFALYLFSDSYG